MGCGVVFDQAKLMASGDIQHVNQSRMVMVDRLNCQLPSLWSDTLLAVLPQIFWGNHAQCHVVEESNHWSDLDTTRTDGLAFVRGD
jgi:hypothetical protein